jgi:hypothetical protein
MSDEASENKPATIEERLAYLEEQNEGLKRVGKMLLGLCLLTSGLLVWTQMGSRSALYSEAVILGTGENPRGTLTTTPTGHLAFLFYDHLGILPPSPKFQAIPYLDGFAIYDRQGNPRIVIGVNDKDEAILDVVGPDGKVQFAARPRTAQPSPAGGSTPAPAPPAGGSTPAPNPGSASPTAPSTP